MYDLEKTKNRPFPSNRMIQGKTLVTTVSTCLGSCEECTGNYIDTVAGNYLIYCSCRCHKTGAMKSLLSKS